MLEVQIGGGGEAGVHGTESEIHRKISQVCSSKKKKLFDLLSND